jgi:hypothetical protein
MNLRRCQLFDNAIGLDSAAERLLVKVALDASALDCIIVGDEP